MNLTYLRLEVRRILREPSTMFFVAVLPGILYVIFGATQDYKDESAGHATVGMYIMCSMAAYGAITATTGVGTRASLERQQGWGRQLGLTPFTDGHHVAVKAATAALASLLPVAVIYAIGAATGARGEWWTWPLCALLTVATTWLFGLYGLAAAQLLRSSSAASAAGGSLVVLGFLGNVFAPLSGTMLDIARFTPMYGIVALVRRPITSGDVPDGARTTFEPLWVELLNVAVWAGLLALACTLLQRRGRARR